MRPLVLILLMFIGQAAIAMPVDTFKFDSEQQETIFHRLSNELRCLVCQNQAIADSNADLAKDLRNEIYKMLQQGKTEDQIIDFMVQRYGDFVLYNPPMKPLTWLLWFGPVIALLAGFFVVVRYIRNQRSLAAAVELSSDEQQRLAALQSDIKQAQRTSATNGNSEAKG
jgi:cytochrome c-type biogenesis protein CcmH